MYDKWDDELRKALKRPFPVGAVQWKPGATSRDKTRALAMAYVDARSVMERLDRTVGPGNWHDHYDLVDNGHGQWGVACILTVLGVSKTDVGDSSATGGGSGNELKAAYSDSLKRAAVHFGIGRYLYAIPSQWVGYNEQYKKLTEDPELPEWAKPGTDDDPGEGLHFEENAPADEGVQLKPRETTSTPVQAPTPAAQPPAPAKANGSKNPGEYVLDYGKKHRGKTLAAIFAEDKEYLTWVLGESCNASAPIKTAVTVYREWLQLKGQPKQEKAPSQHRGFSLSPDTMKALLDGQYAEAPQHAAAMVNLSNVLHKDSTTDTVLAWANIYRGKREEGLEKEEAASEADKFVLEGAAL